MQQLPRVVSAPRQTQRGQSAAAAEFIRKFGSDLDLISAPAAAPVQSTASSKAEEPVDREDQPDNAEAWLHDSLEAELTRSLLGCVTTMQPGLCPLTFACLHNTSDSTFSTVIDGC